MIWGFRAVKSGVMKPANDNPAALAEKIARLVQERGWNQEEFARIARLNRLTVRHILQEGKRRLHNATVGACAAALGFSVSELRDLPLEALLTRLRTSGAEQHTQARRRLYEQATQPELLAWIERNPERAGQLSPADLDELLSLQGTGGPMTAFGVEHFVDLIERKRILKGEEVAVAGTGDCRGWGKKPDGVL